MAQTAPEVNPKQDVAIGLIIANPKKNFRSQRDPKKLDELKDSMKKQGQLAPVRVAQILEGKDAGKYDLIIGFGRFEAAKALGWETIRAEVVPPMDESNRALTNLAENLAREDLTTYDQALAFYTLKEEDGLKAATISNSVGKAVSYVNNLARMWEGTDESIKKRWREETSPTFGYDKDGKKIPGAMRVCTNDWLQKLVAHFPKEEQLHELHRALGLIQDDDEKEPGGDGGNGARQPGANKRPGKPWLDKALTAAQDKVKEVKAQETKTDTDETEKMDELNRLQGIIQALKWAAGDNQSIKGVWTNPKAE